MHRLDKVYPCQNATLLEITCRDSNDKYRLNGGKKRRKLAIVLFNGGIHVRLHIPTSMQSRAPIGPLTATTLFYIVYAYWGSTYLWYKVVVQNNGLVSPNQCRDGYYSNNLK